MMKPKRIEGEAFDYLALSLSLPSLSFHLSFFSIIFSCS